MLPTLAGALLCGLAALLTPPTADLAAAAFRAWLWDTHGFVAESDRWFGGFAVPSYSLLFPPLADALGVRLAGALAGTAAAGLFAALATTALPQQRRAALGAGLAFAVAVACGVWIGRMPFTLGVALACGAGLAALRGHPWTAAALAVATAAATPMAALFLAAAALAWSCGDNYRAKRARPRSPAGCARNDVAKGAWPRSPRGCVRNWIGPLVLAGPALAGIVAMAVAWPSQGQEPFVATAFWPAFALALAAAAALPGRVARAGALITAAALLGAFALPTPVGQNALRLGTLLGPPVLVAAALTAAPGRRRRALVALAGAWLYLAALPAVRAVVEASGDPSTHAAFHRPLLDWLATHAARGERIEIPLTRNHWEANFVARRRPIARGWLRQLDRDRNGLFYGDPPLTAASYRAWLARERIRLVAVPDGVPFDRAGRAEARLIPHVLRRVALVPGWKIYRAEL